MFGSSYSPTEEFYFEHLVRSFQRLSVLQRMIILCAISRRPRVKSVLKSNFLYVTFPELIVYDRLALNYSYEDIRKATKDLLRRHFIVEDVGANWLLFWVQAVYCAENEKQRIGLQFADQIVPLFDRLVKKFERYPFDEIACFRCIYSQSLYLRLMRQRTKDDGSIKPNWSEKISFTELRYMLEANKQKSYKEWTPFKRRVLDPAIKDINSNPNTKFTVQYTVSERENRYIDILLFEMKHRDEKAPAT